MVSILSTKSVVLNRNLEPCQQLRIQPPSCSSPCEYLEDVQADFLWSHLLVSHHVQQTVSMCRVLPTKTIANFIHDRCGHLYKERAWVDGGSCMLQCPFPPLYWSIIPSTGSQQLREPCISELVRCGIGWQKAVFFFGGKGRNGIST